MTVPFVVMWYAAFLMELVYLYIGFEPWITRKELNHSAIQHLFSIEKAKKQLGYKPNKGNIEAIIADYRKRIEPEYIVR